VAARNQNRKQTFGRAARIVACSSIVYNESASLLVLFKSATIRYVSIFSHGIEMTRQRQVDKGLQIEFHLQTRCTAVRTRARTVLRYSGLG